MSQIKWQSKADVEAKKAEEETTRAEKEKFKGKSSLTASERNELLEKIAKDLGYL